jgi:hypothetical protein
LPEGYEYACVLRCPCAITKPKTQLPETSAVKVQRKLPTPECQRWTRQSEKATGSSETILPNVRDETPAAKYRAVTDSPRHNPQATTLQRSHTHIFSYDTLYAHMVGAQGDHNSALAFSEALRENISLQIRNAEELIKNHRKLVTQTMRNETVPGEIWRRYWDMLHSKDPDLAAAIPQEPQSWNHLQLCAEATLPKFGLENHRLAILQAIHYSRRPKPTDHVDRNPDMNHTGSVKLGRRPARLSKPGGSSSLAHTRLWPEDGDDSSERVPNKRPRRMSAAYDIPEWAGTSSPRDQTIATDDYNTWKTMPLCRGPDLDGMSFPEFPTSAMGNQDAQMTFPLNIEQQFIDPQLTVDPQFNIHFQRNIDPQLIDPQLMSQPPTQHSAPVRDIDNGN